MPVTERRPGKLICGDFPIGSGILIRGIWG
jgi:hypothetical protein